MRARAQFSPSLILLMPAARRGGGAQVSIGPSDDPTASAGISPAPEPTLNPAARPQRRMAPSFSYRGDAGHSVSRYRAGRSIVYWLGQLAAGCASGPSRSVSQDYLGPAARQAVADRTFALLLVVWSAGPHAPRPGTLNSFPASPLRWTVPYGSRRPRRSVIPRRAVPPPVSRIVNRDRHDRRRRVCWAGRPRTCVRLARESRYAGDVLRRGRDLAFVSGIECSSDG
jgi:hypothetical protein